MKKLLMIAPHLSTGGMPQYLLKQIETFIKDYDVYCIEWDNITGGVLVVQRNQISNMLGDKLITLSADKSELMYIINDIKPDIIHFQEIPESFMDIDNLKRVYIDDRDYYIVVTTHSSHTDPKNIRFTADKFILVSDWSKNKFVENFGEKLCDIWEYPINVVKYDKVSAKKKLDFDLNKKHILHVGLFTAGKNQKEIIELAKLCKDDNFIFHFVGNQSDNFRSYWEPLMLNLPENCIWHGERVDVDDFYMASDLFYFPSLFELNPLSIKEALCYELPIMIRNLDTYGGLYNNFTHISIDQNENREKIINLFKVDEIPGWFSYENLYDKFIEESNNNSKIVEIGSFFGRSTSYLMNKVKESELDIKVDVIDTFKGSLNEDIHIDILKNNNNDIYQNFYDNVKNKENLRIIKDTSHSSSNLYLNGDIDFIMIDGDHSYEGVKGDISDYYYKVKPGGIISGDDYNVFDGTTLAVNEFFRNSQNITDNGINWWYRIPRIQIIHISTRPESIKCKKSIDNISILEKWNFNIKRMISDIYDGEVDLSNYHLKQNFENVNPRHYGCYLSHINALREIDTINYDYTIIMEEDAFIYSNLKEFVDVVHKSIFEIKKNNDIHFVGFGSENFFDEVEYDEIFSKNWHQNLAHCYLINNDKKDWFINKIETMEWDVADLWYNYIFWDNRDLRFSTKDIFVKQIDGVSLIDNNNKKW